MRSEKLLVVMLGAVLCMRGAQGAWYDPILGKIGSVFTGATAEADGRPGAVPAPSAGDQDKYLKGDGTWAALPTAPVTSVNGETGAVSLNAADVGAAAAAHDQAWSTITATPTTLAGYGITDAAASGHDHTGTYEPVLGNPGTTGWVLSSTDAGVRSWIALPDTGIPAPASPAQGDVLYYNGGAWVRLAAGTAGHVLTTAGAGANPAWAAGSGGFPYARQSITYAATLNTDAATGGLFDVTLTGDATLANPTNGTDGQPVKWRLKASGANRAVTLGAAFRIPNTSGLSSPFTITSGETAYFAAIFNNTDSRWDVVSFVEGY